MSKKSIIIMKNLQKSTPKNLANLDTSRPFANGIRLMDVQYLISSRVSVYYGDLVDHRFWDRLDIMVGAYTDGLNILTRQDGFLYKYNYPDKTFKVFDNNNVLVLRRNNIQSLADMKIDFTIFNSHQFEIYLTPEDGSKIYPFLIPAKMKPKKFDMFVYTDLRGVCNIYELGKYEVLPNNFAQKYLAYFPNRYTFMYDPKKPEIVPPPIVEVEKVYTYYQYRTAFHTSFLYKINLASSNPNQWKYCVYDFYVDGDFQKNKKKSDIGAYIYIENNNIASGGAITKNTAINNVGVNNYEFYDKNNLEPKKEDSFDYNEIIYGVKIKNGTRIVYINGKTDDHLLEYKTLDDVKSRGKKIVNKEHTEVYQFARTSGTMTNYSFKIVIEDGKIKIYGDDGKKHKSTIIISEKNEPIIKEDEKVTFLCGFGEEDPSAEIKSEKEIIDPVVDMKLFKGNLIRYNNIYLRVTKDIIFKSVESQTDAFEKICKLTIKIPRDAFARPLSLPKFDLPETGNGLYPMLNPIKRRGETQNNRPIYEPWLIYGFFNNVSRISHDDLDKYDLWLLDLSPNYGR
jgi:hypothetical protein|nr:MAG TPA: hypothetical protein [Caudoviricetes sp.]